MRQSQLFTKTSKELPKEETSINAQLLMRGAYIDKLASGVYAFLPLGLRVLKKIQQIIREEMELVGGQEILMPALSGEENYKVTGRDVAMGDILFSTKGQGDTNFFLNPTHEEVVTPIVKKYTFSYRDLPLAVFQIQDKFRNEARAKNGLLRGREFSMKDLYSFHASEEDLNRYYEEVKVAYDKIYARLGLGELTYLTYASGGTFSKYSHEFQTISEAGEDTIFICEKCHVAINKEIIEEQNTCPICASSELKVEKAIEVGNIFKQRIKFTSAFEFIFKDQDGVDKPVEMGAYGIGPSRIMGTLVEVFHDDKGIVWPESVAPFRVHLLALGNSEEVKFKAQDLYEQLKKAGIEVLFDDRDESAGSKLKDSDLLGLPIRLIISDKTLASSQVEWKRRSEAEAFFVAVSEVVSRLLE